MDHYIELEESIGYRSGEDVQKILSVIAGRYISQNPPMPFLFRAFGREGILCDAEGKYNIDLRRQFNQVKPGMVSYVCSKFWSETAKNLEFTINCYGPVSLYSNGDLAFKSSVYEEVNAREKRLICLSLRKGWNILILKCTQSVSGFGCLFGVNWPRWNALSILAPFSERDGQSSWVFSQPSEGETDIGSLMKCINSSETATGLKWLPELQWNSEEVQQQPLMRIFGTLPQRSAFAWSALEVAGFGENSYTVEGEAYGPVKIWIDGNPVFEEKVKGTFCVTAALSYGRHDILIHCKTEQEGLWGFTIKAFMNKQECCFVPPYPVKGNKSPWFYLGNFDVDYRIDSVDEIQTLYKLFQGQEGEIYWRLDSPNVWIRPFLENELFARWNYPLGVTLYGLLQVGKTLGRKDIVNYVIEHINQCTRLHEYALWDRAQYGYPGINHLLVEMEMLDDCGSLGSAMLEAYSNSREKSAVVIADIIAEYMENRQERLPDGAFYRKCTGTYLENTLWADDLYMSTPFLVRYYKVTGNKKYIDDAAKQFILYKKYLFMPEQKVMSHVYDFKNDTPTYVPWGRGNGWVLFSLSEILEVMPENHKDRNALLQFYQELCEGYLTLQDRSGLWHQVLNHPDSYLEVSCTCMFIYAFARGIQYGWVCKSAVRQYIQAVYKAWRELIYKAIDKQGNIYGVCRGSAFSFSAEYYKNDLTTNINDTHGIGIILLAGIEVLKLKQYHPLL